MKIPRWLLFASVCGCRVSKQGDCLSDYKGFVYVCVP